VRSCPNSSCSSREIARLNQLARQVAPFVGQLRQLAEQPLIGSDEKRTGRGDRGQRRDEEPSDLTLNGRVDLLNLLRRLRLALVVLHQETRNGGAERRLTRLQRQADLRARFRFVAPCDRENAIDSVPELRHRAREIPRLLRRPTRNRDTLLLLQRCIEVGTDPLELRRPGDDRVGLVGIEHVAHRKRELIQVSLDPEQLQRVAPVAIGEVGLQLPQADNLSRDVPRVGQHRCQRNHQSEQQGRRRGAAGATGLSHGQFGRYFASGAG
jgi:hypothetical protein